MLNEDGGQRPAREMLSRSSFFLAAVSLVCVIVKSQGKNVKKTISWDWLRTLRLCCPATNSGVGFWEIVYETYRTARGYAAYAAE